MPDDLKLTWPALSSTAPAPRGDERTGESYLATPAIARAVRVAIATGRPLLVGGPSGSGKSSLAMWAANGLKAEYLEFVVTSRCEAHELLWQFDSVARLGDAQALRAGESLPPVERYVLPGPLWKALDPASAAAYGPPAAVLEGGAVHNSSAVLLIDEIDKAEPDFPNNLLVPLGSYRFEIRETGKTIELPQGRPPLVIITTNRERELPTAFLRRCISLRLEAPNPARLADIGARHFPEADREAVLLPIAEAVAKYAGEDRVSTAEYLDAVRAVIGLEIPMKSDRFEELLRLTVAKEAV